MTPLNQMTENENTYTPPAKPHPEVFIPQVVKIGRKVAEILDESDPYPLIQIRRIVKVLGEKETFKYIEKAKEVYKDEGLLTLDEERKRTLGGIFLKLVKDDVSSRRRRYIWQELYAPYPKKKPFLWKDRIPLAIAVYKRKGKANHVKMTLRGRPGRIVRRNNVVLTTMQMTDLPTLPSDLPTPPKIDATYLIYITAKQWKRVAHQMKHSDTELVVTGVPYFDKKISTLCLYATNIATHRLEKETDSELTTSKD